uniref:Uncharacterized protein n=1 Tax=Arion vulgaris TaxID=1028688 RepID=A0A0B6YTE2_9EUPU
MPYLIQNEYHIFIFDQLIIEISQRNNENRDIKINTRERLSGETELIGFGNYKINQKYLTG